MASVLKDVIGLSNQQGADLVGVSESIFRHRLTAARRSMQERFEGLCGIVSKQGVCYQCEGLRERAAESRRGPDVPTLGSPSASSDERYRARLRVVRSANVDSGRTQMFHDFVWQAIDRLEKQRPLG